MYRKHSVKESISWDTSSANANEIEIYISVSAGINKSVWMGSDKQIVDTYVVRNMQALV